MYGNAYDKNKMRVEMKNEYGWWLSNYVLTKLINCIQLQRCPTHSDTRQHGPALWLSDRSAKYYIGNTRALVPVAVCILIVYPGTLQWLLKHQISLFVVYLSKVFQGTLLPVTDPSIHLTPMRGTSLAGCQRRRLCAARHLSTLL